MKAMKEIIFKYLEGRASETEQSQLLEWLRKKQNRSQFRAHISDWINHQDRDAFPGGGEQTWNGIQEELLKRNYWRWQRSRKIQYAFRYAAVFFFLISVSGAIWYFTGQQPDRVGKPHTNIIAQGGQVSRIELPDGSMVWLNAGSTISYNNEFSYQNRDMTLIGEAYFDVARDETLPLMVNCNGLQVKVLGTKFSASAYVEESTVDVVLEEGSVVLSPPGDESFQYQLQPGELGRFSKQDQELTVTRVNTRMYTAWREGMISIFDQPLKKVAERLEKRYDQKFEVDEEVEEIRYTFTIKNESLDKIIRLMERITPVKAIQSEEVIRFEKKSSRKEVTDQ